jgi:serine/threonine protein kinase
MTGTLLMERYRLEEMIGEGGMASVYRALDVRTGHHVAVKFLRQEFQANPEFLDRFRREATAASRMSHHNIVNLLDIGDNPAAPYLVFEYVDGKTLKEIINEHGRLPQGTAVQISIRILSALRHAHEAGIIHRDIKPQNILVDKQGYIKVSDFGIARMVGTNTLADMEGKQSVMGSVHYFSPEQARGETTTFASDLYSVGVVLYEMLTGKVPFEGETPVSVAMQHVQAQAKPVRELAEDITPALEGVVSKAMSKSPNDRYASALLMAQALHDSLLPNKRETPEANQARPQSVKVNRHDKDRAGLRSRVLLGLLSMILLAGLLAGVYFIYWDIVNTTRVPLMTGELLDTAKREAEQEGLIPRIIRTSSDEPVDTVITQSYDVGEPIKRGDVILLTVSSGPSRKPVPAIIGLSFEAAKAKLERISLEIMPAREVINLAPRGTVLEQEPAAGTMMDAGSIVQLVLSAGQVSVPELNTLKWTEALDIIRREKLILGKIERIPVEEISRFDRVASQLPVAGDLVAEGTVIDLVIYVPAENQPSTSPSVSPGGN